MDSGRSWSLGGSPLYRIVALAVVLTGLLLGAVVVAAALLDRRIGQLTEEPQAIFGAPWYFGFLSNVGVLVWWATAVICLFAGWVGWKLGSRKGLSAIAVGLFTAWLALDDLFLLHEIALPRALPISEEQVFAVYVVIAAAVIVAVRSILQRDTWLLLSLAVVLFFISLVVDSSGARQGVDLHLFEDGPKFLGIVLWAVTFIVASLRVLTESVVLASESATSEIRITRSAEPERHGFDL